MWARVQVLLSRRVMRAGLRGNPLAQWLLRREGERMLAHMPEPSPLVRGPFNTADTDRPLPEDQAGGLLGDYEWKPLPLRPVSPDDLVGRRISDVSLALGNYGMGGHGFLGLDLGAEWFVVPLNGAGSWVELDGRMLDAGNAAPPPWIVDGDDRTLLRRLVGTVIDAAEIGRHSLSIRCTTGAELAIDEDPARRPAYPGTGKPRRFLPDDDLSAEVFLSPTPEIYT